MDSKIKSEFKDTHNILLLVNTLNDVQIKKQNMHLIHNVMLYYYLLQMHDFNFYPITYSLPVEIFNVPI